MVFELAFAVALSIPSGPYSGAYSGPAANLTQIDYILPAERVVIYPPEAEMRRLSNIVLSPEAQNAFDTEFATASYYGAFATSKDGGWGYSVTSNSLEAARDIAMQECLGENGQCIIMAEIVPQAYVPIGPGDVTITSEVVGHYRDVTTNIAPFAMAVSGDGAYSKVWGMPSQAEADAAALSDCEGYRITDLPNLSPLPCVLLPRPRK